MLGKLKYYPCVYAVKNEYQIVVFSEFELLVGIKIGDKVFYDESNGVKKSLEKVHKITVPMSELDKEGKYEVVYRVVKKRKGDFTETENEESLSFVFKPITENQDVHIYQVSDAHQKYVFPYKAGLFFGKDLDLLLINGDSFDYINEEKDLEYILDLESFISKGEIPIIFVRGNHDNRGKYSEKLVDYVGCDNGNSYYTFRLGRVWGIVLDCGEIFVDDTDIYGNTVCHHEMRLRETEFIKNVIKNAKNEYLADGVTIRLLVSHAAINNVRCKPLDIEVDIYKEWVDLINRNIKPHLELSGHLHITRFCLHNSELDTLGLNCPFIIGAEPVGWQTGKISEFIGLAVTLKREEAICQFTDSNQNVRETNTIKFEKEIQPLDEYIKLNKVPLKVDNIEVQLPKEYSHIKAIKYSVTKKTNVFAFIGYPSIKKPKNGYKAVVCVHGGAGYAFYEWIKYWNDQGFVAIAPDFNGGEYKDENNRTVRNAMGGPEGYGSMEDYDLDDKWLYHSILSGIQATSVLYNNDDIDKDNIFAQGISWGGFILLTLASFEKRFKKISIVYSSAFISNSNWGKLIGINRIPKEDIKLYDKFIDPQSYIEKINCPVLFSAGCDDGAFMMKNRMKTESLIPTKTYFSLRRHYTHDHEIGWSEKEPAKFFEKDLVSPILERIDNRVIVKNRDDFKIVSLVATYSNIELEDGICNWFEIEFEREIVLPKDITYYFVLSLNKEELLVSSKVYSLVGKYER